MNVFFEAIQKHEPEARPTSVVAVWVDPESEVPEFGWARYVTEKDRPEIIRVLRHMLEAVEGSESSGAEGDDVRLSRLKEVLL